MSLEKWTQAYDGGKRFGHMTTNLAECINSVIKGARSLPICAIVKTTFERTKDWFVERGTKAKCMLRAGHLYSEDITAQLYKNEQQSAMYIVQRCDRQNSEFEVQEIPTPQLFRRPMSYKVKLNEWWCDCGQFQALKFPCPHVIVVCSFSHLQLATFIFLVYSLRNILKAHEIQFHPVQNQDYWSPYTGPNMIPDPQMRKGKARRPTTNRIHNDMDDPIPNRPKRCSYCRNECHNRTNSRYRQ